MSRTAARTVESEQPYGGVRVELPLPPTELGKNGRVNHFKRHRLFQQHKGWARYAILEALDGYPVYWPCGVTMNVDWHFAGPQPDDDNVWGRVAAYRDAAQEAGLVVNDRQVTTGRVTFYRVPRAQQRCVLTFWRADDRAAQDGETG